MKKGKIFSTLITILLAAGAIALIGWVLTNNKKENDAKTAIVAQSNGNITVRVTEVVESLLEQNENANGNFIPSQQIRFSSENSGRVTKVLVDEGSKVSVGQLLAVIKGDQLSIDVESAEATYNNALSDLKRFEMAVATGGVTQQQLDQAKLNVNTSKARLEQAKLRVGDTYVRSSINGIVNKRMIEPGAVVSPGTEMFEIVNISKLKLAVAVNEQQVSLIKEGDLVEIGVSVFPDKKFDGKITFIAPKSDASLNFPMEIELASNPNNMIRAGMYGTAKFTFGKSTPVMTVPRNAFVGSVSNGQVFVSIGDSIASLKKVVAGRISGEQVEVLQGLTTGEQVIISGQVNLSNGAPITVVK